MDVKVEKKEKSQVVITFTLSKEEFNERLDKVFAHNAKKFNVPGFRPGKAPRSIIEKTYGADVLNYTVIEETADDDYNKAIEDNKLEVVSKPELAIVKLGREEDTVYTVTVYVKPEAKVKAYKGLEVSYEKAVVTKEDIDSEIDRVREQNARTISVEDRALENGDISNIDFEGFKDGVPFEGGKAEGFDLTIGSGQFIPGFEEQMVGMKIGEEKEINVTFPEDYHAKDLAGAAVVFKVKLNSISKKDIPALDDEFVKDVSEFENLEEYTNSIKEKLEKQAESKNKASKEIAVLDKLVENTEVEIPEPMIHEQAHNLEAQTEQELSYQGLTLDMYCQYMGIDRSVMHANFHTQAEKDLKLRLALEAVGKTENVEVSKEEIDAKIDELVKQYGNENDKDFKSNPNIISYITQQLKQEKLIAIIVDSSKEVEAKKGSKKETKKETKKEEKVEDNK
ncbi:MAG: trigger factor [Clostridia bacterium]|nr:trigger factor [Clostridia bacterium]